MRSLFKSPSAAIVTLWAVILSLAALAKLAAIISESASPYLFDRVASFAYARITRRANSSHFYLVFRESQLAHSLLDNLTGIEIGASVSNPFGLNTINVDYADDSDSFFRVEQVKLTGSYVPVDVLVGSADNLPFPNASYDFVVNANVLEHFYDPVAAIEEWFRVIRPDGYIFMIIPHKERTFDSQRPRTTLAEVVRRHEEEKNHTRTPRPKMGGPSTSEHYSVWTTEDFLELCRHYKWHVVSWANEDDKVGDGFMVVLQKAR